MLILVFIFLTPNGWFENTEFDRSKMGRGGPGATVLIGADVLGAQPDKGEIERRVRQLSGRPYARVVNVRPVRDVQGNVVGYNVDIR